jgi:repressor LexA
MICEKCGQDMAMAKQKYGLTPKQANLLSIIKEFIDENEFPPSIGELKVAVGCAANSNIHRMLVALERRGHIARSYGAPRSIKLL